VEDPSIVVRKIMDARGTSNLDALRVFYLSSIAAEAFQTIERLTGGLPAVGYKENDAVPWYFMMAVLCGQCPGFDDETSNSMHTYTKVDAVRLQKETEAAALRNAPAQGSA
jgi:hypothetical protein